MKVTSRNTSEHLFLSVQTRSILPSPLFIPVTYRSSIGIFRNVFSLDSPQRIERVKSPRSTRAIALRNKNRSIVSDYLVSTKLKFFKQTRRERLVPLDYATNDLFLSSFVPYFFHSRLFRFLLLLPPRSSS